MMGNYQPNSLTQGLFSDPTLFSQLVSNMSGSSNSGTGDTATQMAGLLKALQGIQGKSNIGRKTYAQQGQMMPVKGGAGGFPLASLLALAHNLMPMQMPGSGSQLQLPTTGGK